MIADIMTKALPSVPSDQHNKLTSLMGLRSLQELHGTSFAAAINYEYIG
jgi:hypothetical protein